MECDARSLKGHGLLGLSNREIATLILLLGFTVFALAKAEIRAAIADVLRALLHPKVSSNFVGFAVYIAFFVWLLADLGLWNNTRLKDTIIWWLISGIVLLVRALDEAKKSHFFRRIIIELFSVNAFLAFYLELHSFSLPVELVLQPGLVMLLLMIVVSRTDPKYERSLACLNYIFAIVFVNMALLTGWHLVRDLASIDPVQVIRTFSLPIVLTMIALPYAFVFALFVEYGNVFLRMRFRNGRNPVPWKVRIAVMKTFNVDLHALGSMDARCAATIARTTSYRKACNEAQRCKVR